MQPVRSKHFAARALLVAMAAYALFYVLGLMVAHRPPGEFDVASHVLIGHGTFVAWILTESLYLAFLAPLAVVLTGFAVARPAWRWRIFVSIFLLVAMWGAADVLQHFFARPRRMDWILKHETAFSYPSSHAALAVAFYGYWAFIFARSELVPALARVLAEVLTALVIAILWSRLALGAHYPSDLAGGVLLGVCAVSLALAACAAARVPLYPGFLRD